MFRYLPAILHVSKLIWQFFERVCHASSSGQWSLQVNWSVIVVIHWAIYNLLKVILWLLSFHFISLYDWSWKLAPVSQPIRYKTRINHDFVTRVFPRFGRVIIVVSVLWNSVEKRSIQQFTTNSTWWHGVNFHLILWHPFFNVMSSVADDLNTRWYPSIQQSLYSFLSCFVSIFPELSYCQGERFL